MLNSILGRAMQKRESLALVALGTVMGVSGCGDGATCPSDIVVFIQSPSNNGTLTSVDDSDSTAAGIQRDVVVRSNLGQSGSFTLTVKAGDAVVQVDGTGDSKGDITFSNVTFPAGAITLSVTGASANDCGGGSDEITVNVVPSAQCDLLIAETPVAVEYYAPIPVLNTSNDSDGTTADFQANVGVTTGAGFEVEVFVLNLATGVETSAGKMSADSSGAANVGATLGQGAQAVRATCKKSGVFEASATNTVHVDTLAPTCTLDAPVAGVTITPNDDTNANSPGIQMVWSGTVDDGASNDTEGEPAIFSRDATEFAAPVIDSAGKSSTQLGEFTSPGTFAVAFTTRDHAANSCSASTNIDVELDGCAISVDGPTTVVTTDTSGNAGVQTTVAVTVATECAGQDVFVKCGDQAEASKTIPAGGVTSITGVTIAANASSQGSVECTARVVNAANYQTTASRTVTWDTAAPTVGLNLIRPAGLVCGQTISRSVANDSDGDLGNGFQVGVSVFAPDADTRTVSVVNGGGTVVTPAPDQGATVDVTLAPGDNNVFATATDSNGNSQDTAGCAIRLADIDIAFTGVVADGELSIEDGILSGGKTFLSATICVVSATPSIDVTVSLAGSTRTTTLAAGEYCTDSALAFTPGTHVLTALAVSNVDTREGSISMTVEVDIGSPETPTNFAAVSPNHQTIDISFDDDPALTYELRYSDAQLSSVPEEFVLQGEPVPGLLANGTIQFTPVNAGQQYFFGLMAVDSAGNRSSVARVGPLTPAFDPAESIAGPPEDGAPPLNARFGMRVVAGNFNNDEFGDVAMSAPYANFPTGKVYIYYGSADGVVTPGAADVTPDVIIENVGGTPLFGYGMARIDWNEGGDGLAISAMYSNAVYIFYHDTLATPGTLGIADADFTIATPQTADDWFTGGFVGRSLTSGQVDANNTPEDLIIGVPYGGSNGGKSPTNPGGDGGIAIVFGGTRTAGDTITLSSNATSGDMLGLAGIIFENPQVGLNGSSFAERIHYLGDTQAGNGVGDVAVAYLSDNDAESPANDTVYVLRGRSLLTPGMSFTPFVANSDLAIVNPSVDTTTEFGISVSSIADQNGNGYRDIVIGANIDNEGAGDEGRVWIIDGSQSGTTTLTGPADYLSKIAGGRIGTSIVNNNHAANPDINGDGLEDLVIAGKLNLNVWYGGRIPVGDSLTADAHYRILRPDNFYNEHALSVPAPYQTAWIDDLNSDGRSDLVWTEWQGTGGDWLGYFTVLFDL